jgi:hypothetical protein
MDYGITPVPKGCQPQTMGLGEFQSVAELPPAEVVSYFRAHAEAANRVLGQSYDKRYSPSTFVEEADGGYRVGWFDRERQHVQRFADFSEAVADYILFSFGKGRLLC